MGRKHNDVFVLGEEGLLTEDPAPRRAVKEEAEGDGPLHRGVLRWTLVATLTAASAGGAIVLSGRSATKLPAQRPTPSASSDLAAVASPAPAAPPEPISPRGRAPSKPHALGAPDYVDARKRDGAAPASRSDVLPQPPVIPPAPFGVGVGAGRRESFGFQR